MRRAVWGFMSALLAVAGAVQFNDPDSLRWVVLYWAAAVVAGAWPWRGCLPAGLGKLVLLGAFAIEVIAVGWGVLLLREAGAVGAVDLGSEVQREFGGLLVVLITMAVALRSVRRLPRESSAGADSAGQPDAPQAPD